MTDLDLSTLMLAWIIEYGSPVVAVALLVGALGLPVPGTIIVIATGAFIRQELLDVYNTPLLALVGVVAGDTVVYVCSRLDGTTVWSIGHLAKGAGLL